MKTIEDFHRETIKAVFGTYVDIVGTETGLTCGQCDWTHVLPAPFLMGDAVDLAIKHRRVCTGGPQDDGGRHVD